VDYLIERSNDDRHQRKKKNEEKTKSK